MTIAVDFDGTIVTHEYPLIGEELPFATDTLRMLIAEHHRLILWTVREGRLLDEAIAWCRERGVEFYAVNKDYPEEDPEKNNHFTRKLKADLWIDDRNLGGLPDWGQIYHMIHDGLTWKDLLREARRGAVDTGREERRRKWWSLRALLPLLAALLMVVAGCDDSDSFTLEPGATLSFGVDTVSMDTVFSNVPSATASLWIYNRTGDGIRCSSIRQERGGQSGFRVNVDGTYLGPANGWRAADVEIRGGDSLRVFVELTAPAQHAPEAQLVTDALRLELESGEVQTLPLRAWAWDATLIDSLAVTGEVTLSGALPTVIRRGISVASGATLTIAAGSTLYFMGGAGITVAGTLRCAGEPGRAVTLRGSRIDRMFDYLPYDRVSGQWQGLHFTPSSRDNLLEYTDVHSALDGVVVDSSAVVCTAITLRASTIHNCQGVGLRLCHVRAVVDNCQVSNTLGPCVEIRGGEVAVNHATVAQFYPFDSARGAALDIVGPLGWLRVANSLVTGYAADEVYVSGCGEGEDYRFEDCILRTPVVATADSVHFCRVDYEQVADTAHTGRRHFRLVDADRQLYDFGLDSTSTAIGRANPLTALPTDHEGRRRDERPDVGAFEYGYD